MKSPTFVSFFSGCGGLDLGFSNAGFKMVYANDNDRAVAETFKENHGLELDQRSITKIKPEELPEADGMVGGPPCQSWSLAGMMRGAKDARGSVFYDYVRLIEGKKPSFFLAENVPGIVSSTHLPEFEKILERMSKVGPGYNIAWKLVDARDYGVPQERRRVIVVGYRKDMGKEFEFPEPSHPEGSWLTLKEAIKNLPASSPAKEKNKTNGHLKVPNHEHMTGSFSMIYMSRNRVRSWDQQSFTIQAGGRHAPIHPQASKMVFKKLNRFIFDSESPKPYRRLSVRECARIQTFPDDFKFLYTNVSDGYKMVGNAVPVKLAEAMAKKIKSDLFV